MKQSTFCWLIRLYFWSLIILLAVFVKPPYDFMAFNTFLGYLPIEVGMLLRRFNDRRALAFWVLLIIWLLFYPNAPYVSTDLFHLSWLHPHTSVTGILKTDPVMWLIFAMMLVCALSCLILGTISLDHTTRQLTQLTSPHHPRLQYCWLVLFMLTASTGIYIGRFLRLHSIYLLFTPSWFFKQLWGIWSWPTVEFILILTGMQLIVYWLLKLTQQASKMI